MLPLYPPQRVSSWDTEGLNLALKAQISLWNDFVKDQTVVRRNTKLYQKNLYFESMYKRNVNIIS